MVDIDIFHVTRKVNNQIKYLDEKTQLCQNIVAAF